MVDFAQANKWIQRFSTSVSSQVQQNGFYIPDILPEYLFTKPDIGLSILTTENQDLFSVGTLRQIVPTSIGNGINAVASRRRVYLGTQIIRLNPDFENYYLIISPYWKVIQLSVIIYEFVP